MLRATKDLMLPTTITGSLPRPSWYTQNLGSRSFLDAMVNNQFREQYVDTVGIYLHEQEMAGLDIPEMGVYGYSTESGNRARDAIREAGAAIVFPVELAMSEES